MDEINLYYVFVKEVDIFVIIIRGQVGSLFLNCSIDFGCVIEINVVDNYGFVGGYVMLD